MKKKLGPLTYLIQTQDGLTWKRHIDCLNSLGNDDTVLEPTNEDIIFPTWLDTSSPSVPDINQPQLLNNDLLNVIHYMIPDIHLVSIFKKVTMTEICRLGKRKCILKLFCHSYNYNVALLSCILLGLLYFS